MRPRLNGDKEYHSAHVYFTTELWEKLNRITKATKKNRSQVIRELLEQYPED
jgi:metal-responsive CopG/Arc/MetJ family transcriptional regulator